MLRWPSFVALALAALALSPLAHAQWQPVGPGLLPGGGWSQAVNCESHDGDLSECRTPFAGPPVLAQQLSSTPCEQGQTWGSRGPGTVWVAQGCRGQFVDARGQGGQPGLAGGAVDGRYVVRCESEDGRQNECRAPLAQGRMALLRQHSQTACIEGETWGSWRAGSVWVRGGCRGDFGPARWGQAGDGGMAGGGVFRCESQDGRRQDCRVPGRGRPTLLRQLSDAPCIEGQSWGSRSGSVWVRDGCRGEFGPAGGWGQPGWGQPGVEQPGWGGGWSPQIECSSEDRRYNVCPWNPRQGRPRLIEQLSDDACREGYSWGYDGRGQLWVDRGCRGRFGLR